MHRDPLCCDELLRCQIPEDPVLFRRREIKVVLVDPPGL